MSAIIEIKNLYKKFGDFTAVNDLTLSVNKGEVLGFLGPNGAGKTTTIRSMLGLLRPTSGTVIIAGFDALLNTIEAHQQIAYVPGEPELWPNLTGAETLALLAKNHIGVDETYQQELMQTFQFDPHKKVRSYSKGNKQKILLIAALSSKAPILILDEPTSGLDPLMEKAFREEILRAKKNGQTVFLSSHIMSEVEALCDRVAVIKQGKLVELGTLEELRHLHSVSIEATFVHDVPDLSLVKHVTNIRVSGKHVSCQVDGPIADVLSVIAKHRPASLLSREASLEEMFLSHYNEK